MSKCTATRNNGSPCKQKVDINPLNDRCKYHQGAKFGPPQKDCTHIGFDGEPFCGDCGHVMQCTHIGFDGEPFCGDCGHVMVYDEDEVITDDL